MHPQAQGDFESASLRGFHISGIKCIEEKIFIKTSIFKRCIYEYKLFKMNSNDLRNKIPFWVSIAPFFISIILISVSLVSSSFFSVTLCEYFGGGGQDCCFGLQSSN